MRQYTIVKLDAAGEEQLSYRGTLVARGQNWVCIDARFAMPDRDLGYICLRRGDHFREWFYADRWYNIFRVSDAKDGSLKGWYCNITRPARITNASAAAEDLALDVFVGPDGCTLLLDEAEFAALNLPEQDRQQAWQAVAELLRLVKQRQPPFDEIQPAADASD